MPLTFVLTDFCFTFSFPFDFSLVDFFEALLNSGVMLDRLIERSFFCDLNFFFNSFAFLLDDGTAAFEDLISSCFSF